MVQPKVDLNLGTSISKKRRNRRKKLEEYKSHAESEFQEVNCNGIKVETKLLSPRQIKANSYENNATENTLIDISLLDINTVKKMSSNEPVNAREDVLAAREAKKLAKQKAKGKGAKESSEAKANSVTDKIEKELPKEEKRQKTQIEPIKLEPKSKDEVDKAVVKLIDIEASKSDVKTKEQIKADREAKKAAKLVKKKGKDSGDINMEMTVKDVVETLKDIVIVAKEVQEVTAKVQSLDLGAKKPTETTSKSKAELKAERRAKQEAQRSAKQALVAEQTKLAKPTAKENVKNVKPDVEKPKEKSPKPKIDKTKLKSQTTNRVNWFQHLFKDKDNESLKKIAINSNLHPAIIKLGVQLSSGVVTGSNARCVALLDALKKMVKDYTLPAKTEFARGLESHLASSLDFLWAMKQPTASQTNAVKYFRHHLNQLPNNVDEFDAKKTLQEEIDRYIREQIDMAGEAISIAVRNKISNGDKILTYGCSSLIERILREAWEADVRFETIVVGNKVHNGGREMLRRLTKHGVPCTYIDINALDFIMPNVSKVLVGACAVLVSGCVLNRAGAAQTALLARAHNVPVLVAAETHKFSTDCVGGGQCGDPDDLVDKTVDNSPIKNWRSNPNLTPLNLLYDVTPPSLVTALVTELAILPCTSAPVVLRFKLAEYGL